MISYAQNFEDVYIDRAFADVEEGFYVDVGAYHPDIDSITRTFYERGWSGINVEPGPTFDAFQGRTRDINLKLALSGAEGKATFYHHEGDPGTSTLLTKLRPGLERAGRRRRMTVRTTTLDALLDAHAPGRHVHFLKIDIEGLEGEVIAAADWSRHRPELLVIEATRPYTNIRNDDWAPLLAKAGYVEVFFDGINTYHLREESLGRAHAFDRPVNALDYVERHDPARDHLVRRVKELEAAYLAAARDKAPHLDVRGNARFGDNGLQAVVTLGDAGAPLEGSGVYLMRRDAVGDATGAVLHLGGYEAVHLHTADTPAEAGGLRLRITGEAMETAVAPRPLRDGAVALGSAAARFQTAYLAAPPAVVVRPGEAQDVRDSALGLAFVRALRGRSFRLPGSGGAGAARHEGFLPGEVAEALAAAGAGDCAAVVREGDAPVGVRHAELLPALVKAVDELARRLDALEAAAPRPAP